MSASASNGCTYTYTTIDHSEPHKMPCKISLHSVNSPLQMKPHFFHVTNYLFQMNLIFYKYILWLLNVQPTTALLSASCIFEIVLQFTVYTCIVLQFAMFYYVKWESHCDSNVVLVLMDFVRNFILFYISYWWNAFVVTILFIAMDNFSSWIFSQAHSSQKSAFVLMLADKTNQFAYFDTVQPVVTKPRYLSGNSSDSWEFRMYVAVAVGVRV